jgi:autotransporter translocation and assembly factor TamB
MNLFVRYLKRVLLMLALLAAVVIVAGVIYVRTDSFGHLLKGQVINLLATSFRGEVTLGEIDTSIWGALTIHELTIKYGGATVVRIPQIQLAYSLIPLLWHEARLEISAVDPAINLQRESDGEWNLMKALASKFPAAASSGSNAFTIYLDRLGVRNGAIDLAPQGASGPHYRFEAADLDAGIAIKSAGLEAELTELRTRVAAPGIPPADLYAALSYNGASGPAKVRINALRLTTRASAVSISGIIHNVQTLDSDVAIAIDKLAASDLSTILHNYPLRRDITGRIALKGTANAMRAEAGLAAGNSRLVANLQGDLTRKAPTFNGHLSLARLDLNALALPQKLAGMLDVSIEARGEGSDLQALVANAKISARALRVGSTDVGNFDFIGGAQKGNVQFNGNLTNGPGSVNLGGTADVMGNPQYRIGIETKHFNAAGVSQSAPPTDLNSRMIIQGTGSHLQKISARIDFQAVRSVIARVPLESAIQAQIKAGVIDISQGTILSQGTVVSLKGSAGILPGARAQLSYQVRANQIAPWLKLAGTTGDGRLILDGTASGTLRGAKGAALRAQGKLDLQSVRLPNVSVASGHASYDFEKIGQSGWPRGGANTQFTALETNGTKLRAVAANARMDGGQPPHISIAMVVRDENNNAHRLAATVVYQPNQIAGSIDQLILILPDGSWRLAQPAQFTKDQHHIAVERFELANGVRHLTLDASIVPAGAQNVALNARAIDLAVLRPLMPQGQQIAGDLSAEIMISGTSTAPLIEANLRVNGVVMNSQRLGDLNATANYRPSTAALDVALHQDQNHQIRLSGDIPVGLNWAHGFAATIGNNQKIRVYSAGIRLAPFGGVAPRTLRNAAGLLQANLELTGPPLHPAINGIIAIAGGGGDFVPIGVTVTDFEMRLLASPTSIEIAELSAKAGDGTLSGSGSIALHDNYSPGAINASLQIHQWPAIVTQQYNAKINGQIHASGSPDAPRIRGEIDVVETTIHPDLDFLGGSSAPPPDDTIVVIRPGERISPASSATPSRTPGVSSGQHANNQTFKNLAINLRVNIHRNTWIRHENAEVELDGGLDIKKRTGGPLSVVGEIDTVRGWLEFHNKRFTLESGQILFTGGSEIDPNLNIDARYALSDYTVDVIVAGTASKPEIKLQSQPQLAQADILSLILFGTTTSQLGQGQKTTLQQQAQSLAAGAAGRALSESLGLASLGVNVNGASVGLGHYLNENTYVSVSPNLAANASKTPAQVASIQYFLRRWLTITTATMSDGSRQVFLNVNKRY